MWAQMALDQAESGGVLRACAMTLVVAAEDAADAERVRQTVGVLMHNHPSRAVIVHSGRQWIGSGRPDFRRVLEAVRESPADLLGGNRDYGGAERVFRSREVSGAAAGSGSSGGAVVPRDVFTAALEPGPLEPLFPLADKIIFDSSKVADADSALQFLRRLHARGRRVADLHWTRITGWREVLAHLFDDGALRPEEVKGAQVTFGGPSVTTGARYFAGWIRTALPGARVTLAGEDGPPGLRSVTLSTASDSLTIALGSDQLRRSIRMRPPLPVDAAVRVGRGADAGGAGHPGAGPGV